MAQSSLTQIITRNYNQTGYVADQLVAPGTKIYGVLVDWVDVPTALRFGNSGGPVRVRAGDFFGFPVPQLNGLFLYAPPIASGDSSTFTYRFIVFLEPVGEMTAHGDPWDRAMDFGVEIETQPSSGANAANIGFGNLTEGQQRALLGKSFGARAMRLESLAIESSITGRIGLYVASPFPPPAPFVLDGVATPTPVPLGVVYNGGVAADTNYGLSGGCLGIFGEAWDHGGASLLFHLPVQAGVEVPLSELALKIARGSGLMILDESVNSVLRVAASFKVLQLDMSQSQ